MHMIYAMSRGYEPDSMEPHGWYGLHSIQSQVLCEIANQLRYNFPNSGLVVKFRVCDRRAKAPPTS